MSIVCDDVDYLVNVLVNIIILITLKISELCGKFMEIL